MIRHAFDLIWLIGCKWDLLSTVDELIMFMGIRARAFLSGLIRVSFKSEFTNNIKVDILASLKQ